MKTAAVASQLCHPRAGPGTSTSLFGPSKWGAFLKWKSHLSSWGPWISAVGKDFWKKNTGGAMAASRAVAHMGSSQDCPGGANQLVHEQIWGIPGRILQPLSPAVCNDKPAPLSGYCPSDSALMGWKGLGHYGDNTETNHWHQLQSPLCWELNEQRYPHYLTGSTQHSQRRVSVCLRTILPLCLF